MRLRLKEGEELVKKGFATHYKDGLAEGGRIYLTNNRLIFAGISKTIKKRPLVLSLRSIDAVDFFKSQGGIIKSGIMVITKSGDIAEFVVYGRKKWAKEIEDLIEINEKGSSIHEKPSN